MSARDYVDYSKIVIYKIVPKDKSITNLIYVGHTSNVTQRTEEHEEACTIPWKQQHNTKLYTTIRANGKWAAFELIVVEKYPCDDFDTARKREQHWMDTLHANMNGQRAYTSAEDLIAQRKAYVRPERTCDCGATYTRKYEHMNSRGHKEWLAASLSG